MSEETEHWGRIFVNDNKMLVCDHPRHKLRGDPFCKWIEPFIAANRDSKWIKSGSLVGLTVVPNAIDTLTMVEIGEEIAPGVCLMRVNHAREVGGQTTLNLGPWNVGEGRRSIRQTLWNAMAQTIDARDVGQEVKIYTRCPNPNHGTKEQVGILNSTKPDSSYKSVCLFHMVFEKMCTECLRPFLVDGDPSGLAGVPLDA